jgi:ligand-binding SRPBCC domain-containing protein
MVKLYKHSGVNTLFVKQFVPAPLNYVWDFFTDPINLKLISPSYMGFDITSPGPIEKMYKGQIITYKLSPLAGIKMTWVTEITCVVEEEMFIDEQRFGPYKMWHHEHRFLPVENGVELFDYVTYKLPYGPIGHLAHSIFARNRIIEIFDYRSFKIKELFSNFQLQDFG